MNENNIFNYSKNQKNNKKRDLVDVLNDKLLEVSFNNDKVYPHTEYDMDFSNVLVKVNIGYN